MTLHAATSLVIVLVVVTEFPNSPLDPLSSEGQREEAKCTGARADRLRDRHGVPGKSSPAPIRTALSRRPEWEDFRPETSYAAQSGQDQRDIPCTWGTGTSAQVPHGLFPKVPEATETPKRVGTDQQTEPALQARRARLLARPRVSTTAACAGPQFVVPGSKRRLHVLSDTQFPTPLPDSQNEPRSPHHQCRTNAALPTADEQHCPARQEGPGSPEPPACAMHGGKSGLPGAPNSLGHPRRSADRRPRLSATPPRKL